MWKQAIVVPVPKIVNAVTLNDFRPIALTSLIMKCFEKLVKEVLLAKTKNLLDPLQFAYRTQRGVEDATATLLNLVLKHLEGSKTHVKLLFAGFSSAFNSLQPYILVEKLITDFGLDFNLVGWILDFLTDRTQRVRVNGSLSTPLITSTGTPQGCVLSPLLYILYTNDCVSKHSNRFFLKFADDTVIVSLLENNEMCHGPVVDDFVKWCDDACLQLNVFKTKDMIIDFRTKPHFSQATLIRGEKVECVDSYKYLGTTIDNRLCFDVNSGVLCKKGQQRLYCLRKLRSFNVDRTLMELFYKSYIEPVLSFSISCWFGNLSVKHKNALNRIVTLSGKIIGKEQRSLSFLFNRKVLSRAQSVLLDSDHFLYPEFLMLPSGSRYRLPKMKSNRYKYSFVPCAIRLLNGL